MPFTSTPRKRKSTYIDFEQPSPPPSYDGISSSTASSSKSSVCPSTSESSLASMSWFRSENSSCQSLPISSKEKRACSPFKSPNKLVEPLYKICDALSRKCNFKRAGSPKPRSHEIDVTKPRMLDFESPEKCVLNNRAGYRELDLTPLCQMSPLEQKKSTINSRRLIIKRKSINQKSEHKKDLQMMEGKIENIDEKKIDMYKNSGENVVFFGPIRERPKLLKHTDLVPTTPQKGYPEFTSPIAARAPSFTTSTPTRKPDGSIYKKKTSLNRHRSDAATLGKLRQEHLPPRILSSPTEILYNSRRISQAATRRNSMRRRQKNVLEVTYL